MAEGGHPGDRPARAGPAALARASGGGRARAGPRGPRAGRHQGEAAGLAGRVPPGEGPSPAGPRRSAGAGGAVRVPARSGRRSDPGSRPAGPASAARSSGSRAAGTGRPGLRRPMPVTLQQGPGGPAPGGRQDRTPSQQYAKGNTVTRISALTKCQAQTGAITANLKTTRTGRLTENENGNSAAVDHIEEAWPGPVSERVISYNFSEAERPAGLKVRAKIKIVTGENARFIDKQQAEAIRELLQWSMEYRNRQRDSQ